MRAVADAALELDPMEPGAHYELLLLHGETHAAPPVHRTVHDLIELALDYQHAGLFTEATMLLDHASTGDPMVRYYSAWIAHQRGDADAARRYQTEAREISPDLCFPNQIECVPALELAQRLDADDPRAPYYLGNFLYAHRRYDEAIACWERSRTLEPSFATVHRNLGLAYMIKRGDGDRAVDAYQCAFELDVADARMLFELDQLKRKMGEAPSRRLDRLAAHPTLVAMRDDLTIELVTLLNLTREHQQALDILLDRTFHPWEGGEGKVTAQYVVALIELAKLALATERFDEALALLERAQSYPHNLGEGKLPGTSENRMHYHRGLVHEAAGQHTEAERAYLRAAAGQSVPTSAMFYNDQPPDAIYYRGLACSRLGRTADANGLFNLLASYGETHMDEDVQMDYFAVSLPDFLMFEEDLSLRNRIHCAYMIALGQLGLGDMLAAHERLMHVLSLDPSHLGATLHLPGIPATAMT